MCGSTTLAPKHTTPTKINAWYKIHMTTIKKKKKKKTNQPSATGGAAIATPAEIMQTTPKRHLVKP
jgi:hypothetical protein